MFEPIVVVGAGGFGREVLDVIDAVNAQGGEPPWSILGVVDDAPAAENLDRLEARNVPYLGPIDVIAQLAQPTYFAIGVGNPRTRRVIAEGLESEGARAATLVHPSVTHGHRVLIGEGAVICAGVRLTTNIRIGRHVHLNLNSTVGHDTEIGDYVSVNPLASISGDCVIGDEVLVGVAGVVLNGVTVGRGAIVGGSACVVKDVPENVVVKGVPAR